MDWPIEVRRGKGKAGVVLVHDIMGLDRQNLAFADRLNREGYWVASVDLFRGARPKTVEEGFGERKRLTRDAIVAGLRAGFERLRADIGAGAKVGAMGFCMGGGAALQGACTTPFAFCVDYYGMVDDVADVKGLQGPLLLILASEDDRINSWTWGQLLPALDEHRKRVQLHLYPATVHPFHRPDWVKSPFGGMPAYDEAAAEDAWRRVFAFLKEQFA